MPEEDEELEAQGVQLTRKMWRWIDERVRRNHSRSRSAELRRVVGDLMEAERTEAVSA